MPSYSVSLSEEFNSRVVARATKVGLTVHEYIRLLVKKDLEAGEEEVGEKR